jgi:hypothetical protein
MNEQKEGQLRQDDANREPANPSKRPYWTRAHRDWRIWACVILMLSAMIIYVMTGDPAYRIHVYHP